jgi:hypothetical protein
LGRLALHATARMRGATSSTSLRLRATYLATRVLLKPYPEDVGRAWISKPLAAKLRCNEQYPNCQHKTQPTNALQRAQSSLNLRKKQPHTRGNTVPNVCKQTVVCCCSMLVGADMVCQASSVTSREISHSLGKGVTAIHHRGLHLSYVLGRPTLQEAGRKCRKLAGRTRYTLMLHCIASPFPFQQTAFKSDVASA